MDLRVLVVGGGIHGVGVLHDLASRGVGGLHLVERNRLASGTSSRSTKLLHGGLRYLEHLGQWGLVREALRERTILLGLLKGIVRPLPIVVPCTEGGRLPWIVQAGLWLYDRLAGASNLPRARRLDGGEIRRLAPYLPSAKGDDDYGAAFVYHDTQMKDDVLVRVVAEAARRLEASYAEATSVERVEQIPGGFRVDLLGPSGRQTVTSRAVVNATGPWCTANLLRWGFTPRILTVLNVGSHLLFESSVTAADPQRSAAILHQNWDGRVVFFMPWFGRWLLGTTESLLAGEPDGLRVTPRDQEYLLRAALRLVDAPKPGEHVADAFAGARTLPVGRSKRGPGGSLPDAWRERPFDSPYYLREFPKSLSAVSREAVLDETVPNLFTVYGGKYTTYRSRSERIGDLVAARLGVPMRSGTRQAKNWFLETLLRESAELFESDPTLWKN